MLITKKKFSNTTCESRQCILGPRATIEGSYRTSWLVGPPGANPGISLHHYLDRESHGKKNKMTKGGLHIKKGRKKEKKDKITHPSVVYIYIQLIPY